MTIGEILEALRTCNQGAKVYFEFCGCVPMMIAGTYDFKDRPALGWVGPEHGVSRTVSKIVQELEEATSGKLYPGRENGNHTFNKDQELLVGNPGFFTDTVIYKVKQEFLNQFVVLYTRRLED